MNDEEIRRAAESIGLAKGERADAATVERRVERLRAGIRRNLETAPAMLTFSPFRRARSWAERESIAPAREIAGASMRDEYGDSEYDLVLEDDGALVYYAVRAIVGALTEPYAIGEQPRELPRDLVVRLVARYLAGELPEEIEGVPGDQLSRAEAWAEVAGRARAPRLEYVAEIIRTSAATGASARDALMARSGKTSATVDRWIREARAADPSLPQAKRHPGKRKTTQTTKGTER